jgi:hypothetical protein
VPGKEPKKRYQAEVTNMEKEAAQPGQGCRRFRSGTIAFTARLHMVREPLTNKNRNDFGQVKGAISCFLDEMLDSQSDFSMPLRWCLQTGRRSQKLQRLLEPLNVTQYRKEGTILSCLTKDGIRLVLIGGDILTGH